MKIRKLFKCILLMSTVMMLGACGKSASSNTDVQKGQKTLYEQGLSVASLVVEASKSEEYVHMLTQSELEGIIKDMAKGDFSEPEAVYEVKVSEDALVGMLELDGMDKLSEGLHKTISDKVQGSLITRINALEGAENLAATSVCTIGKTFVNDDLKENIIYIYAYKDATPIAVVFTVGEGGAVSANGTFVVSDEFVCDSSEEIKGFFEKSGAVVTVTEVTKE